MKNKGKIKEVNSIEELQLEMAKAQIVKGSSKVNKELLNKFKNSELKDGIFYYKDTDNRIYDNKPEWSELHLHTLPTKEIKIYLEEQGYDQQTLDLLNHILYLRNE
jgi:hypothetical protein